MLHDLQVLNQVSANTKVNVVVLGNVVIGDALEEVRFDPWCHNTEFGYQ